jgi:hypothetical protein
LRSGKLPHDYKKSAFWSGGGCRGESPAKAVSLKEKVNRFLPYNEFAAIGNTEVYQLSVGGTMTGRQKFA